MSYGDGLDRYEAQAIAESAARSAASEAERNVGYELSRLRDELSSLRHELRGEQEARRAAVEELRESVYELAGYTGAKGGEA